MTTSLSHIVFTTLPFVAQHLQVAYNYLDWRQVERLQLVYNYSCQAVPELLQVYLGDLLQHDNYTKEGRGH